MVQTKVTAAEISLTHKFYVYRNAAWTATAGSTTNIVFDTKVYDTASDFNATTGVFTAPVAGYYEIKTSVNFSIASGAFTYLYVLKNGATYTRGQQFINGAAGSVSPHMSTIVQCAAGDTIQVQLTNSGAAGTGATGSDQTWMQGYLISTT